MQEGSVWEKAGVAVSVVYGSMPAESYRVAVGRDIPFEKVGGGGSGGTCWALCQIACGGGGVCVCGGGGGGAGVRAHQRAGLRRRRQAGRVQWGTGLRLRHLLPQAGQPLGQEACSPAQSPHTACAHSPKACISHRRLSSPSFNSQLPLPTHSPHPPLPPPANPLHRMTACRSSPPASPP
jgi:hypothetical protein